MSTYIVTYKKEYAGAVEEFSLQKEAKLTHSFSTVYVERILSQIFLFVNIKNEIF